MDEPHSTIPLPILNPKDPTPPPVPTATRMVPPGGLSGTVTLPTVTTTLSPEEAFSKLMSLLSVGASLVRTSSMSEPTLASLPSSTLP